MGADYSLSKISKKYHQLFINEAKEWNIPIEDVYGNYGYEELIGLGDWSNNSYFSKLLNEKNINTFDRCQIELSFSILSQLKIDIIDKIHRQFKEFVLDKISSCELVYSNWDNESNITKLIYMINAINEAINEVDFENEVVLYNESL